MPCDEVALITMYREVAREFGRPGPSDPTIGRPSVMRREDLEIASRYLRWCEAKQVDPLTFMQERFLHLKRVAQCRPKFNALASEKLLEVWRKNQEARENEGRMRREQIRLEHQAGTWAQQEIRALALLTKAMEDFKRPYLLSGQAELCLSAPHHSGGYHPRSSFCKTCPQSIRCAVALNQRVGFDAVALRAGRLDLLSPEVVSALR